MLVVPCNYKLKRLLMHKLVTKLLIFHLTIGVKLYNKSRSLQAIKSLTYNNMPQK